MSSSVVLTGTPLKQLAKLVKIANEAGRRVKPQIRPMFAPQRQRRLTAAQCDDTLEAYAAGQSLGVLGRQYGVHTTTIRALLLRSGVPIRKQRQMTASEVARAAELYASGLSLAAVGSQLGYHAQTIYNQLKRQGVVMRPPAQAKR